MGKFTSDGMTQFSIPAGWVSRSGFHICSCQSQRCQCHRCREEGWFISPGTVCLTVFFVVSASRCQRPLLFVAITKYNNKCDDVKELPVLKQNRLTLSKRGRSKKWGTERAIPRFPSSRKEARPYLKQNIWLATETARTRKKTASCSPAAHRDMPGWSVNTLCILFQWFSWTQQCLQPDSHYWTGCLWWWRTA